MGYGRDIKYPPLEEGPDEVCIGLYSLNISRELILIEYIRKNITLEKISF